MVAASLKAIRPINMTAQAPFWNEPNYEIKTEEQLESQFRAPVHFQWSTSWKITRIAIAIFAVIIFPIGIYMLLHRFLGKACVVRAASLPVTPVPHEMDHLRAYGLNRENDGFVYKRITIKVNDANIDAMIIGTEESLAHSHTWFIHANGNGSFYEQEISSCADFKGHLTNLNANGIVFNYPDVGRSSGFVTRDAVIDSVRAVIDIVADKQIGFKATEIYAWGHSLGSGLLLQAFVKSFEHLKDRRDLKVVIALSRSFSKFSSAVAEFTNTRFLSWLVRFFNWELNSFEASRALGRHYQVKQVILQTTFLRNRNYTPIENPNHIIHDGVIASKAALGREILENHAIRNKKVLAMNESHNNPIFDINRLDTKIRAVMDSIVLPPVVIQRG